MIKKWISSYEILESMPREEKYEFQTPDEKQSILLNAISIFLKMMKSFVRWRDFGFGYFFSSYIQGFLYIYFHVFLKEICDGMHRRIYHARRFSELYECECILEQGCMAISKSVYIYLDFIYRVRSAYRKSREERTSFASCTM